MPLISQEELRAMLPQLVEQRMETPTLRKMQGFPDGHKQPCKVVYINAEHLYYTVEFRNGVRESYKVPTDEMLAKRRRGG